MADPSTYRVIVRARGKGSGYTYLIICTDDPVWSQGTNAFYSSPEAAGEAGRVAMESLMTRLAGERPAPSDQGPATKTGLDPEVARQREAKHRNATKTERFSRWVAPSGFSFRVTPYV